MIELLPRRLKPLNLTAPPDWGEYAQYVDARNADGLPSLEYEGWRDDRAGIVDAETYVGEDWTSEVRYSPDDARTYRYYLRRVWDVTRPVVVFVMLNPSTANAFRNDPTVARVIAFARAMGAGGVVVLNLFALRSTDPQGLRAVVDPVGPENDRILREETQGVRVVFAWGTHGDYMGRAAKVIELLKDRNPECLHLTKSGCPGHPLYLSADRLPTCFPTSRLPQDVRGGQNVPGPQTRRKPWRKRP